MLIHVISRYLDSHKRIVVPQLGAFIVREPDREVVFSELLRRDDGLLRGLLAPECGGEVGAAGEIDRFVFEVRHAVDRGEEFRMEGFGRFVPGPNGTIAFVCDPRPARGGATAADEEAAAQDSQQRPGRVQPERLAEAVKDAFGGAGRGFDPSVRGLRYGKPQKTTDAYRYVDRTPGRSRGDLFIWIAVAVAVVALAAIAYGYYCSLQGEEPIPQLPPAGQTEHVAAEPASPNTDEP